MDGKQKDTRHEGRLARAAAAYERMFGGKSHEELVTLTEREDMAVCFGKELAVFLLEEHVAADPAGAPTEASIACCPKCGQPGKPVPQKGGKRGVTLPERKVRTCAGDIDIRRELTAQRRLPPRPRQKAAEQPRLCGAGLSHPLEARAPRPGKTSLIHPRS